LKIAIVTYEKKAIIGWTYTGTVVNFGYHCQYIACLNIDFNIGEWKRVIPLYNN